MAGEFKLIKYFIYVSLLFFLLTSQVPAEDDRARHFKMAWDFAKQNIYPKTLEERFSEDSYHRILKDILSDSSATIADRFNPFLHSLGISHTHFYDRHELGYYFLRSLFTTRNISKPEVVTIGAQFNRHKDGLEIRAVLEGLPADIAGLQRNDIIIGVNGEKPEKASVFFPYQDREIEITVVSKGKITKKTIRPRKMPVHGSFLLATKNSIRIINSNGRKIGYIHLWAGTDKRFLETLEQAVLERFKHMDGIILDLRDGYGGAWWDYLDPFFVNRDDFFYAKIIARDGKHEILKPGKKKYKNYYKGPLVVLINGGVRSGKEALAYQFKKTKRGVLIGTKTQGAFTSGLGGFADKNLPFLFYLSVNELLLDNTKIEGVGITPDIEIEQTPDSSKDTQLTFAISELAGTAS